MSATRAATSSLSASARVVASMAATHTCFASHTLGSEHVTSATALARAGLRGAFGATVGVDRDASDVASRFAAAVQPTRRQRATAPLTTSDVARGHSRAQRLT